MSDPTSSMLPVLPAAVTAMQDVALRGNPRELYTWLFHVLDTVQYRTVKLVEIEYALRISQTNASISLRRLIELGYVERERERIGKSDRFSYRLVHSNPAREPRQLRELATMPLPTTSTGTG